MYRYKSYLNKTEEYETRLKYFRFGENQKMLYLNSVLWTDKKHLHYSIVKGNNQIIMYKISIINDQYHFRESKKKTKLIFILPPPSFTATNRQRKAKSTSIEKHLNYVKTKYINKKIFLKQIKNKRYLF